MLGTFSSGGELTRIFTAANKGKQSLRSRLNNSCNGCGVF